MKILISLTLLIIMTLQGQAQNTKAPDFTATTIEGKTFRLSDLKGRKIFLAFYRNGSCALCNLRIHELSLRQKDFDKAGIEMIAVFESSIEDMRPYVGKQKLGFTLLADPEGKLYEMYGVKSAAELVNQAMTSADVGNRVAEADKAGFKLIRQEGSNFFRIPADVLINKDFNIVKIHHCDKLIDHLPVDEILKF